MFQAFDNEEFLECIKDLVRIDSEWVPLPTEEIKHPSLYIRPTFIGTEVRYMCIDVLFTVKPLSNLDTIIKTVLNSEVSSMYRFC